MNFSQHHRNHFIQKLAEETFDLLVVGGGITGCGIALDAALRGMKVALVEKRDFGFGTSSRSTKLIHGGLRYLKQWELKLVRDVGRERAIVYRNAAHVVVPEKMLLPIVQNGSLGKQTSSLGLWIYDQLAGVKKNEQRKMLNRQETLLTEPLLDEKKVTGGGLYYEYRTDDARLVIELAKSAFAQGAVMVNHCEFNHFVKNKQGKIIGATLTDHIHHNTFSVSAKLVVNACGPWVDLLRKEDQSLTGKRLQLTKGVHLVFPYQKIPLKQSAYFDAGDGRMIFAIPRNGITYVGTTDTIYNQDIDSPTTTKQDVVYLLKAVNFMFPGLQLRENDVISSWAGLRPLIHEDGKSPSELSRKDEIMVSDSGLISIAGGKLTGYRLMAEKVVDLVAKLLSPFEKKRFSPCTTKHHKLSGGNFQTPEHAKHFLTHLLNESDQLGFSHSEITQLFHRFGSDSRSVLLKAVEIKKSNPHLPALFCAELNFCIHYECIYFPDDFLVRRTGSLFFAREQTQELLPYVVQTLAHEWNWSASLVENQLHHIQQLYQEAVTFE
jgi:glycerol-3-phosphate dehydrogenase